MKSRPHSSSRDEWASPVRKTPRPEQSEALEKLVMLTRAEGQVAKAAAYSAVGSSK